MSRRPQYRRILERWRQTDQSRQHQAGGNVGTVLVDALLAHSAGFHVTVFSRKGSTKTYPASLKVLTVEPSASVDELATTFAGQDAVVDLTRGDGLEDHKKYIDAAVKAGVKRYIPSQYGCDTADERVVKVMKPIFDGKVATAEYLKGKEKDGLTWTGIVTNPFFDW